MTTLNIDTYDYYSDVNPEKKRIQMSTLKRKDRPPFSRPTPTPATAAST